MPQPAPQQTQRDRLSLITGKGPDLPQRSVIHAVEGWGKSSLGAQAPKPVFLQTKGETGLETLIAAGQLPEVPHFPESMVWDDLLDNIDALTREPHEYRTLVMDTTNGAERLCHEHVCKRDFNNDWTDTGFIGYQRGVEVSLNDWGGFLQSLDRLRLERQMGIILLCHTKVAAFKNPEGPDYDRYMPDMHQKTWSLTHKWSDLVAFGNFEVIVKGGDAGAKPKKGKATGGQVRMLYTQRHAAYDAKNRLGLPEEIVMGDSPAEAWANFQEAVKAGRGENA